MLQDKGAIITGGVRGIGFAITQKLLKEGAKVVICSRTKSDLQKALGILNRNEQVAFGIVCDVSKLSECKKLIKFALRNLNKIDILINNAGILGPIGHLETLSLNKWRQTLQTNLMGMVYLSHLVIPIMEKNGGGKIINLCGAGVGGNKTMPNFSAYFTSKFSVAGFTEVLAEELKDKNIQVNSISPGAVNTYLNETLIKVGPKKSGIQMYEQAVKQKRDGGISPKLAAKLVSYLSSSKSNHVSGRLLSAKWDSPTNFKKDMGNNIYRLRRVDDKLIYEKR